MLVIDWGMALECQ